jgi:hypothetical protein
MTDKEKIKQYQKTYLDKHSKIIRCDVCGKSFKEYRLRYHPETKKHLKALQNKTINEKNKDIDIFTVYF